MENNLPGYPAKQGFSFYLRELKWLIVAPKQEPVECQLFEMRSKIIFCIIECALRIKCQVLNPEDKLQS